MQSQDIEILAENPLFKGIPKSNLEQVVVRLEMSKKKYQKNEIIYHTGDIVDELGIVLEGSAFIIRYDIWGGQNILARVEKGEVFGESYACVEKEPLMVDVTAAEDITVLFLNVGKVLHLEHNFCGYQSHLLRNLLAIMAQKNILLSGKMDHLAQRSIREKVLSYLSFQAMKNENAEFTIPFDRQQLADYLSVDRSALSRELSKMKQEKILTYKKNHFILYENIES